MERATWVTYKTAVMMREGAAGKCHVLSGLEGQELSLASARGPSALGFLDTYRTLCLAPPAEILALFEQLKLNS